MHRVFVATGLVAESSSVTAMPIAATVNAAMSIREAHLDRGLLFREGRLSDRAIQH